MISGTTATTPCRHRSPARRLRRRVLHHRHRAPTASLAQIPTPSRRPPRRQAPNRVKPDAATSVRISLNHFDDRLDRGDFRVRHAIPTRTSAFWDRPHHCHIGITRRRWTLPVRQCDVSRRRGRQGHRRQRQARQSRRSDDVAKQFAEDSQRSAGLRAQRLRGCRPTVRLFNPRANRPPYLHDGSIIPTSATTIPQPVGTCTRQYQRAARQHPKRPVQRTCR